MINFALGVLNHQGLRDVARGYNTIIALWRNTNVIQLLDDTA